jgi:hypothetical protein
VDIPKVYEDRFLGTKEIGERRTIQESDTIVLYGGTEGFISSHFKDDTCMGIVKGIFWYRGLEGGGNNEAIVRMKTPFEIDGKSYSFMAFTLYYLNSKYGYDKCAIRPIEYMPSQAEYESTYNNTPVDVNVSFRTIGQHLD